LIDDHEEMDRLVNVIAIITIGHVLVMMSGFFVRELLKMMM
jgi:hypothetical protein